MEEFKDLENLWKQSETKVPTKNTNISKIKNNRMKLKNTHIRGAVLLIATGILILILMAKLGILTFLEVIIRICGTSF